MGCVLGEMLRQGKSLFTGMINMRMQGVGIVVDSTHKYMHNRDTLLFDCNKNLNFGDKGTAVLPLSRESVKATDNVEGNQLGVIFDLIGLPTEDDIAYIDNEDARRVLQRLLDSKDEMDHRVRNILCYDALCYTYHMHIEL